MFSQSLHLTRNLSIIITIIIITTIIITITMATIIIVVMIILERERYNGKGHEKEGVGKRRSVRPKSADSRDPPKQPLLDGNYYHYHHHHHQYCCYY